MRCQTGIFLLASQKWVGCEINRKIWRKALTFCENGQRGGEGSHLIETHKNKNNNFQTWVAGERRKRDRFSLSPTAVAACPCPLPLGAFVAHCPLPLGAFAHCPLPLPLPIATRCVWQSVKLIWLCICPQLLVTTQPYLPCNGNFLDL